MAIYVLQPGPLTTVQDMGRFGYQASGMPVSGVMDHRACRDANALVGNSSSEAVLEFTLLGGMLRFTEPAIIALTGADMSPSLNGNPCPMYTAVPVKEGAVLSLSYAKSGCRTYLAVSGGIDVPFVMGSKSTYIKCGIGGFHGRALAAGDIVEVGKAANAGFPGSEATPTSSMARSDGSGRFVSDISPASSMARFGDSGRSVSGNVSTSSMTRFGNSSRSVSDTSLSIAPSVYPEHVTVRVIEGPQADHFTDEGLLAFYSGSYTVSVQSDRMGCRLDGPAVTAKEHADILSDGTVFGSIQITSAGQPVILMAERQTTGGYAKIATVCTADLPVIAQCRPGNTVRFQKITLKEAQELLTAVKHATPKRKNRNSLPIRHTQATATPERNV